MSTLKLDDVREMLPELDELRPLMDYVIVQSEPDDARTWSGSGQLDTLGSRVIAGAAVADAAQQIAAEEAAHLGALFVAVGRALAQVADGDAEGAAMSLLEAAALEEGRDRPERAEAYAEAAYHVVRNERDRSSAALALRRSARAARAIGKLDVSRDRYEAAHEAAMALGDQRGAAEAAVGAGNVLEDQGRWSEARHWYESALGALSDIAEPVPERLHALLNLHIVVRAQGGTGQSLAWLARAEEEAALVDPDGAAPFLENAWGQLRMSEGDFGRAESHLSRGLSKASDARARVTIRLNLAEALLAQGRALDSAEHAREAEREAIAAGLVPKLPEVYRLLGRIACENGDADAFVLFERALEIVRDRGLPILEEALTLQAYAEAEALGPDPEAARELHSAAQERLGELGITHMRQTWADVFGSGTEPTALPNDGETDAHP